MTYSGTYTNGPSNEDILNFFNRTQPKMRDVTPADFRPTPKPRPKPAVLVPNIRYSGPQSFDIRMPNGLYLAQANGKNYELRLKEGRESERQETAAEKFTHVYNKFREFWP